MSQTPASTTATPARTADAPTILIVDDEVETCFVLSHLLERFGYRVACRTSGEEALEYLTHAPQRPGLVLLDVMMPGVDGMEVLRRIRANPDARAAAVPVVMYSAVDDGTFRDYAGAKGATDFWLKSLADPDALRDRLYALLPPRPGV